jgi:hypothetical protein
MILIDRFFSDIVMQDVLGRTLGWEGGTVLIVWEKNLVICKSTGGEVHYDLKILLDTLRYSSVMQ